MDGRHLVTTSTPRSVAKLAFSLIGNNYAITTPTYRNGLSTGQQEEANSKARASFLLGLWKSWRGVGQKDAYFDLVFNQVVRGRSVLQVAWIAKPDRPDPWRPPILFRSLNPKNVGFIHDDVALVAAYHTYEETARKLKLRYPEIVNLKEMKNADSAKMLTFTDYWWRDVNSGEIYNCYLINNKEYLRSPKKTELPLIPLVIRSAQEYSLDQPGERVGSFLDDLIPEWQLENELESMVMTGLKMSFWKEKYVRNKNGEPVGDLMSGPGAINEVGPTFEFVPDAPQSSPDFNTANMVKAGIRERIQKASLADSLYGMSEPSTRSAFMLNTLTQAGMSVLGSIVQAVARTMMEANSIALCMVKKFSVEPMTVYAYDEDNTAMRGYSLDASQIHDSYENHVLVKPAPSLPDDLQRLSIGIQLVVNKIMSGQTVRENLIPFRVPDDEKERILREMAEQDPDVIKELIRKEFARYTGYELPPAEPDFQRTPPAQPQPQPGAPSGGTPMQPPQGSPGAALPPEAQGQIPPEAMMGNASPDPAMLDMMMGQNIDPRTLLGG